MNKVNTQQPAALHYAEVLENFYMGLGRMDATGAAIELRRLHAELESIKQALAAPVQEPKEWDERCVLGHCGSPTGCELSNRCRADTPPAAQRLWVGLTNEEIAQIYLVNTDKPLKPEWLFARAIERKLKEKNT